MRYNAKSFGIGHILGITPRGIHQGIQVSQTQARDGFSPRTCSFTMQSSNHCTISMPKKCQEKPPVLNMFNNYDTSMSLTIDINCLSFKYS